MRPRANTLLSAAARWKYRLLTSAFFECYVKRFVVCGTCIIAPFVQLRLDICFAFVIEELEQIMQVRTVRSLSVDLINEKNFNTHPEPASRTCASRK